MTSDSHYGLERAVTEDDYIIALGRIEKGEHSSDDLNLVRAWEARNRQRILDTIEKARMVQDGIGGGRTVG